LRTMNVEPDALTADENADIVNNQKEASGGRS